MLNRCKTTTPIWCVAFAFVLTVAAARWVSYVNPAFHYNIGGMHIHHYMYGIFMLTVAGYFALVFKGPRATFWIALLYGWGAGFTFDEMRMWLNSSVNQSLRWDREGVIIGISALSVIGTLSIALKRKREASRTEPEIFDRSLGRENDRLDNGTIDILAAQEED
jgi:hypothetical protein